MPTEDSVALVSAYLIVDQPRQRIGHWSHALAPIDSPIAPALALVTAHYDPTTDQALIEVRYDQLALDGSGLAYLVDVALRAEIGMIQPGELSAGERQRFLGDRLERCTVRATGQRTAVAALGELVRRLKRRATNSGRQWARARSNAPTDLPPVIPRSTRDDLQAALAAARASIRDRDLNDRIYARYLRGGRWVPLRVGALSLKGAALLAGALPRAGDRVDIALSFADKRTLVRGAVSKVSTIAEAAETGAPGFSVDFLLDHGSRRELTALLTAARASGVTIKAPPSRASRRFPVEWPVRLASAHGTAAAEALDVSFGGLFVTPHQPLEIGATVGFSSILDDHGAPIAGRARVVRAVSDAEASACGLAAGYGLHILDLDDVDLARWYAFLGRVERRTDYRVLVAARPARLVAVQGALAAAGYAVTGGTDPSALADLARADARPIDAAVIDSAWLGAGASWFESMFSARRVPCLTLDGEAERSRASVDQLLSI